MAKTTTKNTRLRYFTSISVPEDLEEVFQALEDILQSEHGVGGEHRIASQEQSGMMTAEDKKKLDSITIDEKTQTVVVNVTNPPSADYGTGTGTGVFNPQYLVQSGVNNTTGVTLEFTQAYSAVNKFTCHVSCTKGDGTTFRNVGYRRTKTANLVTVIPVENDCTVEIICYAIPY